MRTRSTIDAADASAICQACLEAAGSADASVSIAVVDDAGALLRFVRMDCTRVHTVDLALRKARSAATTGVSTKSIDLAIRSGKLSNVDVIGWGGVPLQAGRECVGAVGVSGSTAEIDAEIAERAAAAFAEQLSRGT